MVMAVEDERTTASEVDPRRRTSGRTSTTMVDVLSQHRLQGPAPT
jgi:hypothetical protein